MVGATEQLLRRGGTPPVPPPDFQRQGDFWRFEWGSVSGFVAHSRGMHYLKYLLAYPGRGFHVLELSRLGAGQGRPRRLVERDLHVHMESNCGPELDVQARRAYRARITELDELLAAGTTAATASDREDAARELDFLHRELNRAGERVGRKRTARSDAERARLNVTRALRHSLRAVLRADDTVGDHLVRHVETGLTCSYTSPHRREIRFHAP